MKYILLNRNGIRLTSALPLDKLLDIGVRLGLRTWTIETSDCDGPRKLEGFLDEKRYNITREDSL